MIRLLVADDHPVVRSGVRNLLRDAPDIRVAAEAGTAADVLREINTREFDAILLDLALPDGTGLDILPLLHERRPRIPAVIFTNSIESADRCIAAGAAGFLSKDAGIDELRRAIEAAVEGRCYISVRNAGPVAARSDTSADDAKLPHLSLSRRELEIMLELVRGKRPKEIACALGISEKTVATHRARLMRKLNVSDMRELLLYGLKAGLTDWC